jgi:hypothetical protein
MNTATLDISHSNLESTLRKATELFQNKRPEFSLQFLLENGEGAILFKPGCFLPFRFDSEKIEFADVDLVGMQRQLEPDSPWKDYKSGLNCDDAYTYITALFKTCLTTILSQPILSDGIGAYKENIDDPKFDSLKNWKEHHKPRSVLEKLVKKLNKNQDKEFFPEL